MSETDRTIPTHSAGRPVRTFRVEILSGEVESTTATATDDAITIGTAKDNTITLGDRHVSGYHLELRRHGDRIEARDLGSTNGTHIGPALLRGAAAFVQAGTELRVGRTRIRVADGETRMVEEPLAVELPGVSASSDSMRRVLAQVASIASSDVSVLFLGESGTGKEVLARGLHDLSSRRAHPFVTLDCAAVAPTLVQSTLFGHERGAFTGAERRHVGVVERAGNGTLFLDEIGELSLETQATLLGVLERKTFTRVGGDEAVHAGARIVCATHRDLRAEVNRERFRLDLYYRLAVVTVVVPPLRDRPEDIEPLIRRFAIEEGFEAVPALFGPEELAAMRRHPWPGNVRELRNVVSAALALGAAPSLARRSPTGDASIHPFREAKAAATERFELEYLERLMQAAEGSVRKAAKLASMNRGYLTELLERHRLK